MIKTNRANLTTQHIVKCRSLVIARFATLCLAILLPSLSWAEQTEAFQKQALVGSDDIVKIVVVFFAMVALLIAGAIIFKKTMPNMLPEHQQGQSIRVIETKRIAPRTTVTLLKVDQADVLLTLHKDQMSTVVLPQNTASREEPES